MQSDLLEPNPRRARLEHASLMLREYPESAYAWYWQIQVKILTFFLAVYGDVEEATPPPEPRPPRLPSFIPVHAVYSRRFKSVAEIRQILQRIALVHGSRTGTSAVDAVSTEV